jgi:tetratricopeptide (TPR) repeat protein
VNAVDTPDKPPSPSGRRSITTGGDNKGITSAGDNTVNIQAESVIQPGALRPLSEVAPTAKPVGVPGVGVFVGRDDELAQLHAALSEQGTVVVWAVHGLGGIGKSTLAARYALEHAGEFSQVLWVTADTQVSLDAGLVDFAVALEPQLSGVLSAEGLRERALGWLATHDGWLLVLDNVAEPALVRDLLTRIGSGRVVVTSRRTSGWAGIAEPLPLKVLTPEAARDLIANMVGSGRTRLLAGVEPLCERLGFLPLALEQAAAYMTQNSVTAEQYLDLLDQEPANLYRQSALGTPAERTLARIWAVSLDALSSNPLCGTVLRVLAWLSPDGVPRELLAGLGSQVEVLGAVGQLAAYSMLTQDDLGTITVHRLVQAVARTGQEGDAHREPVLVEESREQAGSLLYQAIPGEPEDPACWPDWRELTPQVAAFAGYAPPETDAWEISFLLDRTATFLEDQGTLSQSISYFQRAVAANERRLGTAHPNTLAYRNNLARAYHTVGDHIRAIKLYEQNLADSERILGPEHPNTLNSRNNLAESYYTAGDEARAIELHIQNLADRERILGPEHPDTLQSRNNLASSYRAMGDNAQAIELHKRNIYDSARIIGLEHPNILNYRNNLAVAYHEAGDYSRAIELLTQNLADRERILGPEHPNTLTSRDNLAHARAAAAEQENRRPHNTPKYLPGNG